MNIKYLFKNLKTYVDNSFNIDKVYPIGSIYMSVSQTNPQTLFGGTWQQIKDTFLLGVGDIYQTPEATGGEATHVLTNNELPKIDNYLNINVPTHASWDVDSGVMKYDYIGQSGGLEGSGLAYGHIGIHFGNDQEHNNMPPYLTVYIWKRTA